MSEIPPAGMQVPHQEESAEPLAFSELMREVVTTKDAVRTAQASHREAMHTLVERLGRLPDGDMLAFVFRGRNYRQSWVATTLKTFVSDFESGEVIEDDETDTTTFRFPKNGDYSFGAAYDAHEHFASLILYDPTTLGNDRVKEFAHIPIGSGFEIAES